MRKQELKKPYTVTLDPDTKIDAAKFAKDRYNVSLSKLVDTLLADFVEKERRKKSEHPDQASLI